MSLRLVQPIPPGHSLYLSVWFRTNLRGQPTNLSKPRLFPAHTVLLLLLDGDARATQRSCANLLRVTEAEPGDRKDDHVRLLSLIYPH